MGYRLAPHLFCQRPSILRHQSFLSLLALQFRVIGSLILRETRATFGTSRLGYLWALITPVAGILVLVVIFSFAGRLPSPYGGSLALFLALGLLTLQFYTELASKLMTVFSANQALLTYPPIKAVDTVLARFILISLTYLLINMIFVIGLVWFDLADWPAHPHQLFLAFLCTAKCNYLVLFHLLAAYQRVNQPTLIFCFGYFLSSKRITAKCPEHLAMESGHAAD